MDADALPTGVLLAAGAARRFGGGKLLARLPDGTPVGAAACRTLVGVLPDVVAVVRPGDDELAAALASAGARIVVCPRAEDGMGASLACGVSATPGAAGWIVALADMPWIRPQTVAAVAQAIREGASIAAPFLGDERGHPTGFARAHAGHLVSLTGDQGARALVAGAGDSLVRIVVEDPGVLRDVDAPADLAAGGASSSGPPSRRPTA
ncbi:MAG: nucleotidyltransferase family protein [Burkholderiales bacterium]